MSNEDRRRKITVHIKARNPDDARGLLEDVKETVQDLSRKRPNRPANPPDIEIDITADEPLETQAREHAAKVLDDRDRELRDNREQELRERAEAIDNLEIPETSWSERERQKRANLARWLGRKLKAGWNFTAEVVIDEIIRRAVGS